MAICVTDFWAQYNEREMSVYTLPVAASQDTGGGGAMHFQRHDAELFQIFVTFHSGKM